MSESCETGGGKLPFKEYIKTKAFRKTLIAVVIGGLAGYLYYYFVGCASGSCGITSNPYMSTGFGAFFGFWLTNRPCGC